MTKEEIEIQACLYEDSCHVPSIYQHFIDGAEWAEKEVIEKACEWLKENSDTMYTLEGESECIMNFETADDMIAYFRKAMER